MPKILLIAILFLGLFLRVWGINEVPYGFTPDEASFGYDAYSILLTGRDQWGHKLPLVLESFGDYKPPLYTYILVPFVSALGLEKSVIRLPNALIGAAAIYVTFLMILQFAKADNSNEKSYRRIAWVSSTLLAISSWHIMMSRAAFEANLTTFLIPLGILLFLRGLKKPPYFTYSALVFGLNLFSYHSAKLVTPLLVVFLVMLYRKELWKLGVKKLITPFLIFGIFFILMGATFLQGAGSRVSDINIFKNSLGQASSERIELINAGVTPSVARLIHNKYFVGVRWFTNNYLQYFSPNFLFTQGPAEATYGMIPGKGVLYWFEMPLLFGFLIFLAKGKLNRLTKVVLFWFLIAPIPASLAIGPGYAANRAVIMLPAIYILLGIGYSELCEWVRQKLTNTNFKILFYFYMVFSAAIFLSFLENYFFRNPTINAKAMLYPNLEAAYWVTQNFTNENIYVSKSLSEPHIYIGFAAKIDPKAYQRSTSSWRYSERGLGWVDQLPQYSLANFTFKAIHVDEYINDNQAILVGRPDEFPQDIVPIKEFYYPNGDPAIFVVRLTNYIFAIKQ